MEPKTGTVDLPLIVDWPNRSHQLRVHMAETGHAILGDPIYAEGAAADFPRLMLHAESLRVKHPDSGVQLSFTAPVPL